MTLRGLPSRTGGFSLLEAIVAMTLVAMAGLAIFSWINNNFISLNRAQVAQARAQAQSNALQYLQTVNPMEQPSGSVTLGTMKLQWQARPLTEPQPNRVALGQPGVFTVILYEVDLTIEEPPLVEPTHVLVRQMGYRRNASDPNALGNVGAAPTPVVPRK